MFAFVFVRTLHCELDINCPYLILLQCIEEAKNSDIDDDNVADKIRLEFIDQHFVSYRHSNDYLQNQQRQLRQQRQQGQFVQDTKLLEMRRRGNHLIQRTRCLINSKGIDMGEERLFVLFSFWIIW